MTHFLYEKTQRSPIVIPVINVIGGKTPTTVTTPSANGKTPEDIAKEEAVAQAQAFCPTAAATYGTRRSCRLDYFTKVWYNILHNDSKKRLWL